MLCSTGTSSRPVVPVTTSRTAGKRTLAVLLGDARSRGLYVALLVVAFLLLGPLALIATPAALLGLLAVPIAVRGTRTVLGGATGRDLVPVLRDTGLTELVWAVGVAVGLAVGAS